MPVAAGLSSALEEPTQLATGLGQAGKGGPQLLELVIKMQPLCLLMPLCLLRSKSL